MGDSADLFARYSSRWESSVGGEVFPEVLKTQSFQITSFSLEDLQDFALPHGFPDQTRRTQG